MQLHNLQLLHRDGTPLGTFEPLEGSYHEESVGNIARLVLVIVSDEPLIFPLMTYTQYRGETFTLYQPAELTKVSSREYRYTLTFGASGELMRTTKYKFIVDSPRQLKSKFPLTATPRDFLDLLVRNLNEREGGYYVGDVLDAPHKTLAFSHETCLEALERIAEAFKTEWSIQGKRISLGKVEKFKDNPLALGYGKGKGLRSGISIAPEANKFPIGRLFVISGERNIDRATYARDRRPEGASTLLLPKSQTITIDSVSYQTDERGEYISLAEADTLSRGEEAYDASDIYPHRLGVVSQVFTIPYQDKETGQELQHYDFTDLTIPETLNFAEHRLPNERAFVTFQSGRLAGQSFDIATSKDGALGYNHTERRFRLVSRAELGIRMPEPNTFYPEAGDKYAVFGIRLPQQYIHEAEQTLLETMAKYLHEHKDARLTHKAELDALFARQNWQRIAHQITLGGCVHLSDKTIELDAIVRIASIRTDLTKPYMPQITLSNSAKSATLSSALGKLEAQEVIQEGQIKQAVQAAERTFAGAQKLVGDLADSLRGEFDKQLSPISVKTMQLLVGSEQFQFDFFPTPQVTTKIPFAYRYDHGKRELNISAQYLRHYTIGQGSILASANKIQDLRLWKLPQTTYTAKAHEDKLYVYAICPKLGEDASWLIDTKPRPFDNDPEAYTLLVGILQGEEFTRMHGFTEVSPARVTTARIVSQDGSTYFDLERNEIRGNITFLGGKTIEDKVKEANANDYLRRAIHDGSTTIAGGLISTGDILLRDEAQQVRSLISGNPSNQLAFVAGIDKFGQSDQSNRIELRHDGTAKLGNIDVLGDRILVRTDETAGNAVRFGGDPISYQNLIVGQTQNTQELVQGLSRSQTLTTQSPDYQHKAILKSFKVNTAKADVSISAGTLSVLYQAGNDTARGYVRLSIDIILKEKTSGRIIAREGVGLMEDLQSPRLEDGDDSPRDDYSLDPSLPAENRIEGWGRRSNQFSITASLEQGEYILEAVMEASQALKQGSTFASFDISDLNLKIRGSNNIREVSFTRNSLTAAFGENKFLHLQEEGDTFLAIRGKTDMPGVLASGECYRQGEHSNQFGAKASQLPIRKEGNAWIVPHNIGHTRYHVFITINTLNRWGQAPVIVVRDKRTDRFSVYFEGRDGATHTHSSTFSYLVIGDNSV